MLNLIESYVNTLSEGNMNMFLKNDNIYLLEEESSFLLKYIKENWYDIIYKPDTLIHIKEKIEDNNYKKLYELYIKYKNKYFNYL